MPEHECSVCMRRVDPHAALGDTDSGGYIPVQFPNEPPVEVWLHHRCLLNDGRDSAPIDGRTILDHADPHHRTEGGGLRPTASPSCPGPSSAHFEG